MSYFPRRPLSGMVPHCARKALAAAGTDMQAARSSAAAAAFLDACAAVVAGSSAARLLAALCLVATAGREAGLFMAGDSPEEVCSDGGQRRATAGWFW
jgi:hypothetical protein